jgi:hypothetical protein
MNNNLITEEILFCYRKLQQTNKTTEQIKGELISSGKFNENDLRNALPNLFPQIQTKNKQLLKG